MLQYFAEWSDWRSGGAEKVAADDLYISSSSYNVDLDIQY